MKFIHLTDTHLVAPGDRLYGLDPSARLEAAVAHIAAHHGDAVFAIVTGDLVHRGEPAAYAFLRDCLSRLPVPCHLVAGNHDDRTNLLSAFPDTPHMPDGFIQYAVDVEDGTGPARLIVLDTVRPGSGAGFMCETRLAWLGRALDDAGDLPVFLFMHHPPMALGIPDLDDLRLAQHAELAALLAGRDTVRHLFFGHVHRPAWGSWQGIPFTTLPSLNHQSALVFERTDGIIDSHEPPAYAVVRADTDGTVVVNPCAYLDTSVRFYITGPQAVAEDATASQLLTASRALPKYGPIATG